MEREHLNVSLQRIATDVCFAATQGMEHVSQNAGTTKTHWIVIWDWRTSKDSDPWQLRHHTTLHFGWKERWKVEVYHSKIGLRSGMWSRKNMTKKEGQRHIVPRKGMMSKSTPHKDLACCPFLLDRQDSNNWDASKVAETTGSDVMFTCRLCSAAKHDNAARSPSCQCTTRLG